MSLPAIDVESMWETLLELIRIPSPTGYTDQIVRHTADLLAPLCSSVELTRRGAIRAHIAGEARRPARAIVAHLDTIGALVRSLGEHGRPKLVPIGTWSSRFAEGARVTVFTERGPVRGTILPLKASGHVYGDEVDLQPTGWDHVELRLDLPLRGRADVERAGVAIGDFVAIDPSPEVTPAGYIASRHLDDKAGVAAVIAAARAVAASGRPLPVDCNLLFTISEEVGTGASAVLHGDIAELVAVDNATLAPTQESSEVGVTVAMADSTGPFDYHLTRRLLELCQEHSIAHVRDVLRYYRCDAAAAIESGNDLRTALVGLGVDASHGYERVHVDSIISSARLIAAYMLSPALFSRDRDALAPVRGFPEQPTPDFPAEPVVPERMPRPQEEDGSTPEPPARGTPARGQP